MAALDYLRFEPGNPLSQKYCGWSFETLDLFGYFEQYRVKADGTIWLIPTAMVPSGRKQRDVDAPELIKVDLPQVQVVIDYNVVARSDEIEIELIFRKGFLIQIETKQHVASAA